MLAICRFTFPAAVDKDLLIGAALHANLAGLNIALDFYIWIFDCVVV